MPPLLFIHGASCSARVWDSGFLARFRAAGYECHAIDLPGHGAQPRLEDLDVLGMDDYGAALEQAVAACTSPPVLIGHSMGGYLAQRHVLRGGAAAGLILLAAAPPQGMMRELFNFALRHPLLALRLDLAGGRGKRDARLQRVRGMLFTPQTPEATVATCADLLQPESARALRELSMQRLPARPLDIPLRIHAGARDPLISVAATRSMAQAYGVRAILHAHTAHMLQMEPGWEAIVDDVIGFLASHCAGETAAARSGVA